MDLKNQENEFRKILVEIREKNNESLRTMAKKLNITPAFLSAIEIGKKIIPEDYADTIGTVYNLSEEEKDKLMTAINISNDRIKISLENMNDDQRDVALVFARKIQNADPELIEKLRKALEE